MSFHESDSDAQLLTPTGNPRMRENENSASLCRRLKWGPGTLLSGDEGYGETVIALTAIGEDAVLGKALLHAGSPANVMEGTWTLECRDWREITDPAAHSPELAVAVTNLRSRAPCIPM